MSIANAEEPVNPAGAPDLPTPSELVSLAALVRPEGLRTAAGHDCEELLCEAFELWQVARAVVANKGQTRAHVEGEAMMSVVEESAAKDEAEAAAKAAPEMVVAWTDARLWAGLGEGRKAKGETPGQVAERIYHKYRERMISDGRKSDVRPQSQGINLAFALEFLREPRKRGRKPEGNRKVAESSQKNSESTGINSITRNHISDQG